MRLADFAQFFRTVNGFAPFAWQVRLCEYVGTHGRWPDRICAPTGSGKSHAAEVHVFVNALAARGLGPRVPRRLVSVVNRRALVDDMYEHAREVSKVLASRTGTQDDIVSEVSSALFSLVDWPLDTERYVTASPLVTASLRGGVRPQTEWIDDPRACALIAATPEMAGSRLLFRGYGASRYARPREAGLLAHDSVLLVDEAHLSRQLLKTARVVADDVSRRGAVAVPGIQVVETTATPPAESERLAVIQVAEDDLEASGPASTLVRRLRVPKPLIVHRSLRWPKGRATTAYVRELADLAMTERDVVGREGTTGCVVNNVETAVLLAEELDKRLMPGRRHDPDGSQVLCWVGPMRPMDVMGIRTEHERLLVGGTDPRVAFVVATQTVEVGVNLDFDSLVTELAPGSSLSQRAGRVNRMGRRDSARVVVVAPATVEGDRPPYRGGDLRAAAEWLDGRVADPLGMAPWALVSDPAPLERTRRLFLSALTPTDRDLLANTSDELFAEPELAFWLRDDLDPEVEPVHVVVRGSLPPDDAQALEVLRVTGVSAYESFPADLWRARLVCEKVLDAHAPRGRVFCSDSDEWSLLTESADLRPGSVIVVDTGHALTTRLVIDPAAERVEHFETMWRRAGARDPLELPTEGGVVVLNDTPSPAERDLLELAADLDDRALAALLTERGHPAAVVSARRGEGEVPEWLILMPANAVSDDAELRQEKSARGPVLLETHARAVALVARRFASDLGLPEAVVEAQRHAGLHHDDGKVHPEMQVRLACPPGSEPWAKSGPHSTRARRDRLPGHWRHEQYSVLFAASAANLPNRDLVLRLVGTSHGRGRPFFPHGSGVVEGDPALLSIAEDLFDGCGWSDILERTEATYGVWGCAYLEAVLRSADCMVSKEGS